MKFAHIDLLLLRLAIDHFITEISFELVIQVTIPMIMIFTIIIAILIDSIMVLHLRAIIQGRVIGML